MMAGVKMLAASIRNGSINLLAAGCMIGLSLLPVSGKAQLPIAGIIQMGIKKVIVAVDLSIQRMQTETLLLQESQQKLENDMQKTELEEIADWVERQRRLFADYYEELREIKLALTLYRRVAGIIQTEEQMIREYQHAWGLIRRDVHFSAGELDRMARIYAGLLDRGSGAVNILLDITTAFVTSMEDGERLRIIDELAAQVGEAQQGIRIFTQDNILLSLQRSKDRQEVDLVKSFYGL